MTEFDPNDWQGRSKKQVETNTSFGALSFIGLMIWLIFAIALKILVL